jgi:hypothetical protein
VGGGEGQDSGRMEGTGKQEEGRDRTVNIFKKII